MERKIIWSCNECGVKKFRIVQINDDHFEIVITTAIKEDVSIQKKSVKTYRDAILFTAQVINDSVEKDTDPQYKIFLIAWKKFEHGSPGFRKGSPSLRLILEKTGTNFYHLIRSYAKAYKSLYQDDNELIPDEQKSLWLREGLDSLKLDTNDNYKITIHEINKTRNAITNKMEDLRTDEFKEKIAKLMK